MAKRADRRLQELAREILHPYEPNEKNPGFCARCGALLLVSDGPHKGQGIVGWIRPSDLPAITEGTPTRAHHLDRRTWRLIEYEVDWTYDGTEYHVSNGNIEFKSPNGRTVEFLVASSFVDWDERDDEEDFGDDAFAEPITAMGVTVDGQQIADEIVSVRDVEHEGLADVIAKAFGALNALAIVLDDAWTAASKTREPGTTELLDSL